MEDNWANNDTIGYGYETDGGYVLAIQRMLKDTPWGYSAVDGYWGSKTYNGVVNFQRNEGIAADGIVGPVTWEEFECKLSLYFRTKKTLFCTFLRNIPLPLSERMC
nr:peptidoglycan-binding domain-containing protein [Geobacillus sp. BMUD]